jgi:hypothetical protein
MCFWFGLEILRLVYTKELKNFFEIGHTGYPKKRNFDLISKMCRSREFGKREKIFLRKTKFLGTWKILQNLFF